MKKPFDLEKALAGEPLVTRDGSAATQLTRFDCDAPYQLVAVVRGEIEEFTIDGRSVEHRESPYDLFMYELERWVNVYWNEEKQNAYCGTHHSSEAEAKANINNPNYYQTTIKLK